MSNKLLSCCWYAFSNHLNAVNYGQQYGFKQDVLLRIQVEGVKAN
jgi:hypothetical protein